MRLSLAPVVIWAALFTLISASSVDTEGTPQTDSDPLDLSTESVDKAVDQGPAANVGNGINTQAGDEMVSMFIEIEEGEEEFKLEKIVPNCAQPVRMSLVRLG